LSIEGEEEKEEKKKKKKKVSLPRDVAFGEGRRATFFVT